MFDPGGAIADDVVEALFQLVEHPLDPLALQRILVARLRSRKDVEAVVALIFDQRLIELGVAVDHVDEIKDDPALAPHDQVEVAQAYVEIDDNRAMAAQCQPGRDRGGAGRLADAALPGSEHNDFCCQKDLPSPPAAGIKSAFWRRLRAAITGSPPCNLSVNFA